LLNKNRRNKLELFEKTSCSFSRKTAKYAILRFDSPQVFVIVSVYWQLRVLVHVFDNRARRTQRGMFSSCFGSKRWHWWVCFKTFSLSL